MKATTKIEVAEEPEPLELPERSLLLTAPPPPSSGAVPVIDLSSSGSDSDAETERRPRTSDSEGVSAKKRRLEGRMMVNLPPGFLDPLPSAEQLARTLPLALPEPVMARPLTLTQGSRQFWKAGDFEGLPVVDESPKFSLGMDHVRVHPKFLHSNATSHKWALGAFAELLDNSLDEVCNGASFVNIDMLENEKDGTKMLLIEDNGGGLDPDKMRQCMSFGYSAKSKIANCIGQYGNGFKTSTMRLGADVIVFSRSCGKERKSPTKSIGMLSYTFLRNTGKEDIVVPMLDYEKRGQDWEKMLGSSVVDWNKNVDIIVQWSPYSSEVNLLKQFDLISDHGTLIVIYNLWEDDQGKLELDFDTDKLDIQIRGVNRDEKKIQMAKQFPNSKHFLTYRHSMRSYASILYLRLPHAFRMILRGKEIEHHNIVNDMMLKHEVTYRPQPGSDGFPKDPNMIAVVTIGFVKDAKHHIDVQGFNVYHKNRLIKPFWRVWNAAGSDGRGVIGVLEANFVEPAHDKQGFERTTVLSRLEARLVQMQKTYWSTNCHKVGYAPRCKHKRIESEHNESSPEDRYLSSSQHPKKGVFRNKLLKDSESSPEDRYLSSSQHPKKGVFPNKLLKDSGKFLSSEGKKESSPEDRYLSLSQHPKKGVFQNKLLKDSGKFLSSEGKKGKRISFMEAKSVNIPSSKENGTKGSEKHGKSTGSSHLRTHGMPNERNESDSANESFCTKKDDSFSSVPNASLSRKCFDKEGSCRELFTASPCSYNGGIDSVATRSQTKEASITLKEDVPDPDVYQLRVKHLENENDALKQRIKTMEESMLHELQHERNLNKSLVDKLKEAEKKLEEANTEQEALIDIFSEERSRRDEEEATLRKRLKEAQDEIHDLVEKLATNKSNANSNS